MLNSENQVGYTLIIVLWSIVILSLIFSFMLDDVFLDGYLIEEYSQQKELRQAALSVYSIGLNRLLNDETRYDSNKDKCFELLEGNIEGISYTLNVRDVGSKININYDQLSILREIENWEKEIEEELEKELIADIFFLKEVLPEDQYLILKEYTTTYGNYNLNQDTPEKIKLIYEYLDLNHNYSDGVTNSLKKLQKTGKKITDLDEFPVLVEGINLSTFEILKPFLSLEGRININFVNEEILKIIFKSEGINDKVLEKFITYREEEEITEIEDISNLLSRKHFENIRGLFITHSKYIEITVDVVIPEKRRYEIRSIVKRDLQDEEWTVEVLSWDENEIFLE